MAGVFEPNKSISISFLFKLVNDATQAVKTKLETMKAEGSGLSITEMFEVQILMNHLSQLSEMSTSVMSAANTCVASAARNIK